MTKNEFLKEQASLLKRKMTDPSIEWQDVAEFRAQYYDHYEHRDTVRKGAKLLLEYINDGWDLVPPSSVSLGYYSDDIELEKKKVKLQTEKQEYKKWIRELARDELITEHIVNAVNNLEPFEVPVRIIPEHSKKGYLLTIADAHYGVEFDIKDLYGRTINAYSPEIFERRMWTLFSMVLEKISTEDINELHIFELGDSLDGILRANSQLMQLRYGIIDSGILYADFLATWLNELSKYVRIKFQMVKRSNHNQLRIVGQPKNAFPDEDMSKSMLVLIKERLKNNPNVTIIENPTGMDFAQINTYTVLGGHFETKDLGKTIDELSRIHCVPIDYLVSGHWHSLSSADVGIDSEVISTRSIIGVNPYSMSINKTANAGASMFVFEQGFGKVCEYSFKLN